MKICVKCNKQHPRKTSFCPKCYYLKNKDSIIKYQKDWIKKNQGKRKQIKRYANLKWNYGITKFDFEEIFKKQKYKCAICKKTELDLKQLLCLDHNHKDFKIRGILCRYCNSGLGMFKDDIKLLKKAIEYLEKN